MSDSKLPEHVSLDYLKRLARERLQLLRQSDPEAQLPAALLAIARDHGFTSWRALRTEIDRRTAADTVPFFTACASGDLTALRDLLARDPSLVRAADPAGQHAGWTGLHTAAKRAHAVAVRLLLEHGADPNAREAGDNTTPLHWAAATGDIDTVRALLDAGADANGFGDFHELDVIGWATNFSANPEEDPADVAPARGELLDMLQSHGARHHIFSALCFGNFALVRRLAEADPRFLDRRMSRFEHGLTPLQFAILHKRYDMVDLLIELGADLDAHDFRGNSALQTALLHGDHEAGKRLRAAGAEETSSPLPANVDASGLAASVAKIVPMIFAADVARSLEWYKAIGFEELARYGDAGLVNFGMVKLGGAEVMINMHGKPGHHDSTLWFYTSEVDAFYRYFRSRSGIEFDQDIEDMFYGARQFAIRDPDGYILYFIKPSA